MRRISRSNRYAVDGGRWGNCDTVIASESTPFVEEVVNIAIDSEEPTLQKLADEAGMRSMVCSYPPGTSNWSKNECRLFCRITRNWSDIPLVTH
ncbi:MAG: ISAzo13-like element transposase-related protein [Planctomycetales bacterium]